MTKYNRREADREWMADGACVGMDGAIFFDGSSDLWRLEHGVRGRKLEFGEAKEVCAGCTVRIDCLAYAIAHHEEPGVWGGLDEQDRKRKPARMTDDQRYARAQAKLHNAANPPPRKPRRDKGQARSTRTHRPVSAIMPPAKLPEKPAEVGPLAGHRARQSEGDLRRERLRLAACWEGDDPS